MMAIAMEHVAGKMVSVLLKHSRNSSAGAQRRTHRYGVTSLENEGHHQRTAFAEKVQCGRR
jgi:hypothetical protein